MNNTKKALFGASLLLATITLMSTPSVARAEALTRSLHIGMSGADVKTVQQFLAQDTSLYPQGKVTGYFGFLTKSAVSNFQTRNGLGADGYIGQNTRPVMNAQIAQGMNVTTNSAPTISNHNVTPTMNGATVNWNTDEQSKGVVYYSTTPLSTYEYENSVTVSGMTAMTDSNFRTTQNVWIQNLQANTTYYYMIYTTDQSGNVNVTVPGTFRTSN